MGQGDYYNARMSGSIAYRSRSGHSDLEEASFMFILRNKESCVYIYQCYAATTALFLLCPLRCAQFVCFLLDHCLRIDQLPYSM